MIMNDGYLSVNFIKIFIALCAKRLMRLMRLIRRIHRIRNFVPQTKKRPRDHSLGRFYQGVSA